MQMGSSFEDLVTRDLTVKTDRNSDKQFKSYGFLKFSHLELNASALGVPDFPKTASVRVGSGGWVVVSFLCRGLV